MNDPRELLVRESIVDCLSKVQSALKLENETFFIAVHLFSRYLDAVNVNDQSSLATTKQLIVGATCLFVAAKY